MFFYIQFVLHIQHPSPQSRFQFSLKRVIPEFLYQQPFSGGGCRKVPQVFDYHRRCQQMVFRVTEQAVIANKAGRFITDPDAVSDRGGGAKSERLLRLSCPATATIALPR